MTSGSPFANIAYDSLRESLTHAGAVIALPELHGGICGALCAGGPTAAARWLDEMFADPVAANAPDELFVPLQELVAASWRTLDEAELAFEPLLPDDDSELEEQVQSLAAWCQGFLGALGLSAPDVGRGRSVRPRESAPIALEEILTDFAEIGRAGLTDDDAADRDRADFALAELKEYVRVSVQIVFDELADRRAAAARDVH